MFIRTCLSADVPSVLTGTQLVSVPALCECLSVKQHSCYSEQADEAFYSDWLWALKFNYVYATFLFHYISWKTTVVTTDVVFSLLCPYLQTLLTSHHAFLRNSLDFVCQMSQMFPVTWLPYPPVKFLIVLNHNHNFFDPLYRPEKPLSTGKTWKKKNSGRATEKGPFSQDGQIYSRCVYNCSPVSHSAITQNTAVNLSPNHQTAKLWSEQTGWFSPVQNERVFS